MGTTIEEKLMQEFFLLFIINSGMSQLRMLEIYRHVAVSELALGHFQCELAEKTQFTSKIDTTIEETLMQEIFLLFIINSGMSQLRMQEIYRHVAVSELALEHFQCELAEKTQFTSKMGTTI